MTSNRFSRVHDLKPPHEFLIGLSTEEIQWMPIDGLSDRDLALIESGELAIWWPKVSARARRWLNELAVDACSPDGPSYTDMP